jgi:hypothetical protein
MMESTGGKVMPWKRGAMVPCMRAGALMGVTVLGEREGNLFSIFRYHNGFVFLFLNPIFQ